MYISGKYRGEIDDGECSIWLPLDENAGLCFDFPLEDLDEIIRLLEQMKDGRAKKNDQKD